MNRRGVFGCVAAMFCGNAAASVPMAKSPLPPFRKWKKGDSLRDFLDPKHNNAITDRIEQLERQVAELAKSR